MRPAERLIRVAMLGAIGAALAVVESSWPHPVPWARLGLGNAAVLVALWSDGVGAAFGVLGIKVALAGLIGGMLFQPMTVISAGAGMAAWAAMSFVHRAADIVPVGPVGAGVAGALVYGLTQVWLLGALLVRDVVWTWAPLVIGPAVIAGGVTGLIAALALSRLGYWMPGEVRGG